jgi:iron complex transport system substrate-binding protein
VQNGAASVNLAGQRVRIVSLVPAATQAACALGLSRSVVGMTHECASVSDLADASPRVLTRSRLPSAGTSSVIDGAVRNAHAAKTDLHVLDGDGLAELAPDVVIVPSDPPEGRTPCLLSFHDVRRVTSLMTPAPRLVAWSGASLQEVLGSLRALGEAVGRGQDAARLAAEMRQRIENVRLLAETARTVPRTALLSWLQPPIAAGGILAQLILLAGGEPVLGGPASRTRTLDWALVLATRPEVIVLAPCGTPLARVRQEAEALRRVPGLGDSPAARWGQVHVVDAASWFSAPGLGMVRALEILGSLVHPELPWPDAVLAGASSRPVAVE